MGKEAGVCRVGLARQRIVGKRHVHSVSAARLVKSLNAEMERTGKKLDQHTCNPGSRRMSSLKPGTLQIHEKGRYS